MTWFKLKFSISLTPVLTFNSESILSSITYCARSNPLTDKCAMDSIKSESMSKKLFLKKSMFISNTRVGWIF